jgi:hypothetical protein
MNEYPNLKASIKKGKEEFDTANVEKSLLARALGYEHPEEKVFCHNGEIITHNQIKHYPPDVAAILVWLTNRQPERWSKNGKKVEEEKDKLQFDYVTLYNFMMELGFDEFSRIRGAIRKLQQQHDGATVPKLISEH